jgi:hypothetical protein
MSRSLHESFDTAYKGSLKAAARVARRRADRLTVAEALEAMADASEPVTHAEAFAAVSADWWSPTGVWVCACSGHEEVDPVTGEPMDDGWGRCCRKGGGWQYRHDVTGELV